MQCITYRNVNIIGEHAFDSFNLESLTFGG